jgi:hypothetical protein
MHQRWTMTLTALLVGVFAVGIWLSGDAYAQDIHRLAAQFKFFNQTEGFTALGVPGVSLFSKTVFTEHNVLYVKARQSFLYISAELTRLTLGACARSAAIAGQDGMQGSNT